MVAFGEVLASNDTQNEGASDGYMLSPPGLKSCPAVGYFILIENDVPF